MVDELMNVIIKYNPPSRQACFEVSSPAKTRMSTSPPSWLAYVGCRTTAERNAQGQGLAVYGVDAGGDWRRLQLLPGLPNPSYLCLHPTQPVLYAVHGDYSEISSFAIDGNGLLEKVAEHKTWGINPVHLALTPCLRWLLVANYASGNVAAMRVGCDGALGATAQVLHLPTARGPHIQQDGAHPHQICFSPDGRYAFVPDKGSDTVFALTVNQETGFLSIAASTPMPRGCGPRHMVFHPRQPLAYIVGELDRTVTTARYDAASGGLASISRRSTVHDAVEGSAAGVVLSPDATRLFVSNRGHDSVVRFSVAADGTLGAATWIAAGKTPRFITQFPSASGPLLVAREDGHSIAALQDASLAFTDLAQTGSPVCIVFKPGNP